MQEPEDPLYCRFNKPNHRQTDCNVHAEEVQHAVEHADGCSASYLMHTAAYPSAKFVGIFAHGSPVNLTFHKNVQSLALTTPPPRAIAAPLAAAASASLHPPPARCPPGALSGPWGLF